MSESEGLRGDEDFHLEYWSPEAHKARMEKHGMSLDRWNVNHVALRIADYPEIIKAANAHASELRESIERVEKLASELDGVYGQRMAAKIRGAIRGEDWRTLL